MGAAFGVGHDKAGPIRSRRLSWKASSTNPPLELSARLWALRRRAEEVGAFADALAELVGGC